MLAKAVARERVAHLLHICLHCCCCWIWKPFLRVNYLCWRQLKFVTAWRETIQVQIPSCPSFIPTSNIEKIKKAPRGLEWEFDQFRTEICFCGGCVTLQTSCFNIRVCSCPHNIKGQLFPISVFFFFFFAVFVSAPNLSNNNFLILLFFIVFFFFRKISLFVCFFVCIPSFAWWNWHVLLFQGI